jgi:hypothetical protein
MKVFLLACLAFFIAIPNHAVASDFYKIAESEDGSETKIKVSSVSYGKNKKGDDFTSAVFQTYLASSGKLFINERYVLNQDCERGYGRIFTLDTEGKFMFTSDFALEGDSVASKMAKALCVAYEKRKARIAKQAQDASADTKWRETIDEFLKTEALKPDGIDYRNDPEKMQLLDSMVKQLANDPGNGDKTMLWFLMEADRIIKQRFVYRQ